MKRFLPILGMFALLFGLLVGPAAAQMTAAVSVADQESDGSMVTVASVTSEGPGFIVIHRDNDGAPGEVIGNTAVADGENTDVVVELSGDVADGDSFWAMLHADTNTIGTYEFGTVEGADAPVALDGEVVMEMFTLSMMDSMDDTSMMMSPAVSAADQESEGDMVTVASVTSEGPGFIVIHRDNNGAPGEVIGNTAVEDGENTDVVVELTGDVADGASFWAMLHADTNTVGTYEFGTVEGADAPITLDGEVVMEMFMVTLVDSSQMAETTVTSEATPATMPESGASTNVAWPLIAVAAGMLLVGGAYVMRPRAR